MLTEGTISVIWILNDFPKCNSWLEQISKAIVEYNTSLYQTINGLDSMALRKPSLSVHQTCISNTSA